MDIGGPELLKLLVELDVTPTQLAMIWLLWRINEAFHKQGMRITILETIAKGGENG